jgi:hypothetical protein
MNHEAMHPETLVMKFILAKWISKLIHVVATLKIPDILAEGDKSIADLSEIANTHKDSLYRIMRALSSVGIFTETENRTFANTPLSECLTADRLRSTALMFHSWWHDKMWDNLLHTVKTGEPSFEHIFGMPAFDWFEKNPGEAELFHDANNYKAASSHRVIADEYDFGGANTVIDIGGGFGGLIIEILKANPAIHGIVADLPGVVSQVGETIKKHNLEDRMSAVECDFFEKVPAGKDIYLLSHILHDWPDDRCATILGNCRQAMNSESRLIIAEMIVPPDNSFSISKLLDIEVLLMGAGKERSKEEFGYLIDSAGLTLARVINTEENISMIECLRA